MTRLQNFLSYLKLTDKNKIYMHIPDSCRRNYFGRKIGTPSLIGYLFLHLLQIKVVFLLLYLKLDLHIGHVSMLKSFSGIKFFIC